jgi:hypothetical protein
MESVRVVERVRMESVFYRVLKGDREDMNSIGREIVCKGVNILM